MSAARQARPQQPPERPASWPDWIRPLAMLALVLASIGLGGLPLRPFGFDPWVPW